MTARRLLRPLFVCRRFRSGLVPCFLGILATPLQAQTISVGSTSGPPGWLVTVSVTLDGAGVTDTQNDVTFDSLNTPIAKRADGTPDCAVNPGIGKTAGFAFHPPGCYGTDCTTVRAAIYDLSSGAPIPSGFLYSCTVAIAAGAPLGVYPLINSRVVAGDASGNDLGAGGTSGWVEVTGGGCAIPPAPRASGSFAWTWLLVLALAARPRRRALLSMLAFGLLVPGGSWASPGVHAEGGWRADGARSGQWQAELAVSAAGQVSGRVTLSGFPTFRRANFLGTLTAGQLDLILLDVETRVSVGRFAGTVTRDRVAGTCTSADGVESSWEGQWLEAAAKPPVPQAVLDALAAGRPQEVMVKFDDRAIRAEAATMRRQAGVTADSAAILDFKAAAFAAAKAAVLSSPPRGVTLVRDYSHLPTAFVRIESIEALEALRAHPAVERVRENRHYQLALAQSLPLVRAVQAWVAGYYGAGATVAVLDSGADPAYDPSLFGPCPSGPGGPSCQIVFAHDFAPDDGVPDDHPNRHGSNVSAIVLGMAPDAGVAALDVVVGGSTNDEWVAAAINWVIANRDAFNIVAMNMSFLTNFTLFETVCADDNLADEVRAAWYAGVFSVIVSGNFASPNGIHPPACVPYAVRVGAVYDANIGTYSGVCIDPTTMADQVTCFSNSAPILTALAPGCQIWAAGVGLCGTSMAAPHVAGAVALLRAPGAFASDPPDCTVARIVKSGVQVLDPRNGLTFPRLDVYGALTIRPRSVGDCNGDGWVAIIEVRRGIKIALGEQPLANCPSFDVNGSGQVEINELIMGVIGVLYNCSLGPSGNP